MPQEIEPILDVAGVAKLAGDAEMGAQKGGGEFRDQFFRGVCSGAEACRQVAIEAWFETRPMTVMPPSGLCRAPRGKACGYA